MTHFTSEPVQIDHLDCGTALVYTMEFPPKIVMCPGCGAVLKLVGHDEKTQNLAFRTL